MDKTEREERTSRLTEITTLLKAIGEEQLLGEGMLKTFRKYGGERSGHALQQCADHLFAHSQKLRIVAATFNGKEDAQ